MSLQKTFALTHNCTARQHRAYGVAHGVTAEGVPGSCHQDSRVSDNERSVVTK